jgi:hypothetical protein
MKEDRLHIFMPREIKAAVKRAADQDYMSMSAWVLRAIQGELYRQKILQDGPPVGDDPE